MKQSIQKKKTFLEDAVSFLQLQTGLFGRIQHNLRNPYAPASINIQSLQPFAQRLALQIRAMRGAKLSRS